MRDFKTLEVWNESKEIAKKIYKITENFPENEKYGIISQLRRAGASIGANIAEGCGRNTDKDFSKFLHNSLGSLNECTYFLILSKELGYINDANFLEINENLDKTGRKINNFIKILRIAKGESRDANTERRIANSGTK